MQFLVRALAPGNRIETVTIDAADRSEAQREVERQRLQVLSVAERRTATSPRTTRFAVVLFSQELAALLDAGLSVVEALEGMHEKETSAQGQAIVARLLARLRDGERLSTALREQVGVFPPLFMGLVQSAEGTSDLPRALSRYVDYAQRVEHVRARVVSASIYPAVLMVVGGMVCLFLMGYVVPRFAQVYQGSGRALPWMSQLLLDWGQWVGRNSAAAALVAAAVVATSTLMVVRAWRSRAFIAHASRLPGVGRHLRTMELSRLYLTLGTLLEGGIAVRPALDMTLATASPALQQALSAVSDGITQGQSMSTALESAGLATPIAARLVRVGERTGELGAMFMRAAQFHEAQLARAVERFSKLFEPLLMAAIGVVIGLIVILLYMPIFDLVGSFG